MGDYNMAQLSSPGVSVSVIDESFYTPAAPGTVPLIIVASEEAKQNSSNTGTAAGTLKANAGQVYLLTSQKDLVDTFGTPVFKTDNNNNPINAGEQNEYGLQAAYSVLGVSNRAYVVRADIDLAELDATADAPSSDPANNTFWLATSNTKWGIFEWNSASAHVTGGQTFTNIIPYVITDPTEVVDFINSDFTPKASIGKIGTYAVVAVSTAIKIWYKKRETHTAAGWVEVGTTEWIASIPTIQSSVTSITNGTYTLVINGSDNLLNAITNPQPEDIADAINYYELAGITAATPSGKLEIYSSGVNVNISGTIVEKLQIVRNYNATTGALSYGASGVFPAPALTITPHTSTPAYKISGDNRPTGSLWIKATSPNNGADWVVRKFNSSTSQWVDVNAPLYPNNAAALKGLDSVGGGINLAANLLYVKYNDAESTTNTFADFKIYRRREATFTSISSAIITKAAFTANTYTFSISESKPGSDKFYPLDIVGDTAPVEITFTVPGTPTLTANTIKELILDAINTSLTDSNVTAVSAGTESAPIIIIKHLTGGEIKLIDGSNTPLAKLFSTSTTSNFYDSPTDDADYIATLWTSQTDDRSGGFATASPTAITATPADEQLWYSSSFEEADVLVNNGSTWVAYRNYDHGEGVGQTDPAGPIFSATAPTKQSNGIDRLVAGDLWIDTSDMENYPQLYKYVNVTKKWQLVDKSDQTSFDGILFADARWNNDGISADPSSIVELLGGTELGDLQTAANFLDPDAPDAALYPEGMLLWNLRRSGFNVKKFHKNYIDVNARNTHINDELMTNYYPHRWVSEAANQVDGSGSFGRKSQRRVVIQALQALVNSNQQLRDEESRVFNLIACPGYPELVSEMVSLNYDRGLTSFVVADTPARLTPDATSLSNWGNNVTGSVEDNDDGLVTSDEYVGFFYPWGFTSDNIGNNIVVPPSHMMLRTIALNDQVAYPWFPPAGTNRGGITNASAVGYVDAEGEFRSVALNTGQRDTLQTIKVNSITFIAGTGLVNYAQFTRAKNASSLDRINVARLVIFLRRQFAQLAKPYLFEPNDKITRDEIKQAAESLLLELVGQRAIYDYLVVCDTSNNTPARIDRNELYLDVAIEPVKSVEYIYIPLRLKNTGEIKGLG